MQRRLMKALEDLVVHYDNTVRNSVDNVVQFTYGRDGLDPAEMESEQIEQLPDGRQVKRMFPIAFERTWMHVDNMLTPDQRSERALLPWEIMHLVAEHFKKDDWTKQQKGEEKNVDWIKSEIEHFVRLTIVKQVIETRTKFGLAACNERGSAEMDIDESMETPESVRSMAGRNIGKVVISQMSLFLNFCYEKYRKSSLDPGTAIGAICGQSIGEPGTQMTLKTFHFAGLASANITMGVPRIKEIINATATIATPVITVHLEHPEKETFARIVKGRLEKTLLRDVCPVISYFITQY